MDSIVKAVGLVVLIFLGSVFLASRAIIFAVDGNKVGEVTRNGMKGFVDGAGGSGGSDGSFQYQPQSQLEAE